MASIRKRLAEGTRGLQLCALLWIFRVITPIVALPAGSFTTSTSTSGAQDSVAPQLLRLGVATGNPMQEFFGIADVDLVGDSLILVGSHGTSDIRVFDTQGRYVRSWGSSGEGPGEFRSIRSGGVHIMADSVWISDPRLQRVNVFSLGGEFGRSFLLPQPGISSTVLLGVFSDGGLLLRGQPANPPFMSGWHDSNVEILKVSHGTVVEMGQVYWSTEFVAPQPTTPPVAAWASWAIPGGIEAVIRVVDDEFWYADGRQAVLERRHGGSGRVLESIVIDVPAPALDQAELAAAQRRWLNDLDSESRRRLRAAFDNIPPISAVPRGAFDLVVDRGGAVLYSGHQIGLGATRVWHHRTSDGTTSPVRLPAALQVTSLHGRIAAGVEKGADGVEYVSLYRIVRGR